MLKEKSKKSYYSNFINNFKNNNKNTWYILKEITGKSQMRKQQAKNSAFLVNNAQKASFRNTSTKFTFSTIC